MRERYGFDPQAASNGAKAREQRPSRRIPTGTCLFIYKIIYIPESRRKARMPKRILIIGGVAGGATAAARARRISETAEITVVERGPYVSYANCGLPYFVSRDIEKRSKLLLQTPEGFDARYRVKVEVRTEAVEIDRAGKRVRAVGPEGER